MVRFPFLPSAYLVTVWKVGPGTVRTLPRAGDAEAGQGDRVGLGRSVVVQSVRGVRGGLDWKSAEAAWEPGRARRRQGWEPFGKQGPQDPWPLFVCGGKGGVLGDRWVTA